jgi:hypothetical protein
LSVLLGYPYGVVHRGSHTDSGRAGASRPRT